MKKREGGRRDGSAASTNDAMVMAVAAMFRSRAGCELYSLRIF